MINFSLTNLIINKSVLLLFCFTCLLFSFDSNSSPDPAIVLVTSNKSTIKKITTKDIRRIFLGLRPANNSPTAIPVLNTSDHRIYKDFLKNILFLTENGYKRKMLKRVFRQGADTVVSINSNRVLTTYLLSHPDHISFMSKRDALNNAELKILQTLWE